MLIVISPAKTLDFETPPGIPTFTIPEFLDDSAELIDELRGFEPHRLSDLMGISPKLADLNSNRYHNWSLPFTSDNAKQSRPGVQRRRVFRAGRGQPERG